MTDQPAGPPTETKSSRTWLIVLIVVVVLCCLCLVGGGLIWALWTYGDQWFGLTLLRLAFGLA
jgi:hypothetical protein